MKHRYIFSLLAAFCALLFSCQKNPPRSSAVSLTLALRSGLYADVVKSCLADFEIQNDVLCAVQEYSEDDLHKKLLEDSGAIDLCMADSSWAAELFSRSLLTPLDETGFFLDDDIIEATKVACYSDGTLYLAPYYGNVTVLLYNKFIVKEAGFSSEEIRSIDDFLEICRFSNKRHNLGFMYRGDTANNIVVDFLPVLLSFGGWVVDSQNRPTVDTPQFARATKAYIELIKTGRDAKKDDLVAAIANKAAAMGVGWPGWYTPTRNSSMDYLAISGKSSAEAIPFNANIYGIWTIGIPSSSKHKILAAKLLSHLMDSAIQRETVFKGGVPCRYSSLKDEEVLKKFPQYKIILSALESGVYRPAMQEWSAFYTILGAHLKRIFAEEISVEEGLLAAENELNEMLGIEKKE